MNTCPAGWSREKLAAFNALTEAVGDYVLYRQALTALGITDPAAVKVGTDVGTMIRTVLIPRLLRS